MCKRRFPGASQCSGSYVQFVFSASDYLPDSYCLAGTVEAGLRKCRLGRSSCLPVPASSVSDERGSTAHYAACVTPTTSPTHSSASVGSGLRRECGSRRPCSCTRPLMELRRHTFVNCFVSPICLVGVPSALLGPIVCWYRP